MFIVEFFLMNFYLRTRGCMCVFSGVNVFFSEKNRIWPKEFNPNHLSNTYTFNSDMTFLGRKQFN